MLGKVEVTVLGRLKRVIKGLKQYMGPGEGKAANLFFYPQAACSICGTCSTKRSLIHKQLACLLDLRGLGAQNCPFGANG